MKLSLQLLVYTTQAVKTLDEIDGDAPGVWTQSCLAPNVAQKTFDHLKEKELYNIFWMYDTDKGGKNRNFRVYQTHLRQPTKKVVYNKPSGKKTATEKSLLELLEEPKVQPDEEWGGDFHYSFLTLSTWKDILGQYKATEDQFNVGQTIPAWFHHPLDPRLMGMKNTLNSKEFGENNWYLWLESKKAYQSITKQQLKQLGYDLNLLCKPEQA